MSDWYEREENDIYGRLARGDIDNDQAQYELRELRRDYRAAAEEAAQDAYDREWERW